MSSRLAVFAVLAVAACSPYPRVVSSSDAGAFEAALTPAGEGFAVAWYDTRHGNGEIYLRLLDDGGAAAGPEQRLTRTDAQSFEPSLARAGDNLALAWYEKAADGTLTAMLGLFDRDGGEHWTQAIAPHTRNPVVRVDGEQLVAAWIQRDDDGEAVYVGRWTTDGMPALPPQRLAPASATTWNLNAAVDDRGAFWVVFDADGETRASELFLARLDASAAQVVRISEDDGVESKYPDLAMAHGRAALTWYDAQDGNTEVYLLIVPVADLTTGVAARGRRVTATPGESIGAYLAWNGDRLGLAWSDDTAGQHEIHFQPLDAEGLPLAPVRQVTRTRTASLIPAVVPWSTDSFALAWNEFTPAGDGHDGTSEIAFAIVR